MSKAKSWALYNALVATVSVVLQLILSTSLSELQNKSSAIFDALISSNNLAVLGILKYLGLGLIIVVIFSLAEAVCYWLAFVKIDGDMGRGWSVFLLVMGVFSAISILFVVPTAVSALKQISVLDRALWIFMLILMLSQAVFSFLAYDAKRKALRIKKLNIKRTIPHFIVLIIAGISIVLIIGILLLIYQGLGVDLLSDKTVTLYSVLVKIDYEMVFTVFILMSIFMLVLDLLTVWVKNSWRSITTDFVKRRHRHRLRRFWIKNRGIHTLYILLALFLTISITAPSMIMNAFTAVVSISVLVSRMLENAAKEKPKQVIRDSRKRRRGRRTGRGSDR